MINHELENSVERINFTIRTATFDAGRELRKIQSRWNVIRKEDYPDYTFEKFCEYMWNWTDEYVRKLIKASEIYDQLLQKSQNTTNGCVLPYNERQIRPLLKLEDQNQRWEVWQRVANSHETITARLVEAEVERKISELNKDYFTIDEWLKLPEEDQKRYLSIITSDKQFNSTNDNIKWAWWTWNPVTGCEHDCIYCYARDIANRFHPDTQGFTPSIYPNRLAAPFNTKPIPGAGGDKVFVCSMADLFGSWVPNEWIWSVMQSVKNNPQWKFIFLTKNPKRLASVQFPDNAWVGCTVDTQARVKPAEDAMMNVSASIKFVSCEPMLEKLEFNNLSIFDWVIIGAQSSASKVPEFQPDINWVLDLTFKAKSANCKVYWKPNFTNRPEEYPDVEVPF